MELALSNYWILGGYDSAAVCGAADAKSIMEFLVVVSEDMKSKTPRGGGRLREPFEMRCSLVVNTPSGTLRRMGREYC